MRLNRDPNAPKKLTDDQRAKINAEDKELQQGMIPTNATIESHSKQHK
jgi:hypothetical protein